MKSILYSAFAGLAIMGLISCSNKSEQPKYFEMEPIQKNTSSVLWDPEVYDFEEANQYVLTHYNMLEEAKMKVESGACTSWRNGDFHGRNLDWYRSNYGCLIVKMPKGGKVKHASVATVNGNTMVTSELIASGVLSDEMRKVLPVTATDGINDAGIAANINIVPHQPGDNFVGKDGDLCCLGVVRYVLDNAGSVTEAVDLISARKVRQSIVNLAGDEAHYMISGADTTAVIEFPHGQMQVIYYTNNGKGWYSQNNNPAIMANFYDYAGELYPVGSQEFYDWNPTAMGVERWLSVKDQYDNASKDVESNFDIAKSVWYFKNFITDKKDWYTDNATPDAYGKDEQGWYYKNENNERIGVENAEQAMHGYWDTHMESYRQQYADQFGSLDDPHVAADKFWETSHSVVYNLKDKKGYLYPFENFYSQTGSPIVMMIP